MWGSNCLQNHSLPETFQKKKSSPYPPLTRWTTLIYASKKSWKYRLPVNSPSFSNRKSKNICGTRIYIKNAKKCWKWPVSTFKTSSNLGESHGVTESNPTTAGRSKTKLSPRSSTFARSLLQWLLLYKPRGFFSSKRCVKKAAWALLGGGWVEPTQLKNMRKSYMGSSSPSFGVKIKICETTTQLVKLTRFSERFRIEVWTLASIFWVAL